MRRKNEAFTLVEILIVVIILGILAAIVIPQFTSAADDAQDSRLASDLQAVRAQIELFKCEHGVYPGAGDNTFEVDLTTITDGIGGESCGPYLQEFPTNPFTDSAVVTVADDADEDSEGGWYFDTATNKFGATVVAD